MSLTELLPQLRSLPRLEKLRLIQLLAEDMAAEDCIPLQHGQSYPVWTPLHAYEAASILQQALDAEGKNP